MTLQELKERNEAVNFVNKFYFQLPNNGSLEIGLNNCKHRFNEAKKCALIAVEEIYNEIDDNFDNLHSSDRKQYWLKLKQIVQTL